MTCLMLLSSSSLLGPWVSIGFDSRRASHVRGVVLMNVSSIRPCPIAMNLVSVMKHIFDHTALLQDDASSRIGILFCHAYDNHVLSARHSMCPRTRVHRALGQTTTVVW